MKKSLLLLVGMAIGVSGIFRVSAGEWETDLAKATDLAKKDGKNMLLDFSGSDWCGFCIKLDNEVFKTAEFKNFAKQNLVLVMLDFPHSKPQSKKIKEQNAELKKKYEINGFPTVILLTPDGDVLGKTTGYHPGSGPKKYIEQIQGWLDKGAKAGGAGADEKKPETAKPSRKK